MISALAFVLLGTSAGTLVAGTVTKKNSTTNLNKKQSWVGNNLPTAADIALWDATVTSANTVSLGGNLSWLGLRITNPGGAVTINAGNILTLGSSGIDMSSATVNLTLNCNVSLGSNQIWDITSGRTLTASGVVSGNRNLTKNGLGTLVLSGANTFQGTTTINSGTVSINSASSLGTSNTPILINPTGILQATATFSSSRGITLGGTGGASSGGTLDVTGANVETRTGLITGTGSLTKTGTGTLTLTGANTYTGGTYLLGGTLSLNNTSALGPQPTLGSSLYAVHLSNGTTMQGAFTYVSARQVELVSGTATISITQANTLQSDGLIYGNGGLIKSGPGTEILTNANTYTGGTTINGGTLQVNNSSGSGTGTGNVVVNSGGILSGVPTAAGFANPGTISGTVTVNSGGAVTARSGGTFTFGGLTLNAGAASNFQIGAPTSTSIINLTGINGLSLAGPSTVNITNAGGLAGGTYTLFNYSGTALGSIANLSLGSTPGGGFDYSLVNNTANTSIDLLITPTSKQWAPDASGNWNVTTNWTDSVVPNAAGAQANFLSHITSPRTSTVNGTFTVGSITFNNANSYTVASGGAGTGLILNNNGTALIADQQGAHTISASSTLANDLQLNSSAGASLTISGVMSESGSSQAVTLVGPGAVTFSGTTANTYTGQTTVSAGTLNLNKTAGVNAIGGNLEIDSGGTVALQASNQILDTASVVNDGTFAFGTSSETIGALTGNGSITTAAGSILTIGASNNLDTEFDGTISGGGTLTKAGTGTLTLTGANTFGGAGQTINVNAGTLSVGSDGNLGNASNSLTFNGGSLLLTDNFTSARNLILNSNATITNLDDATLNGVISGNNVLTKAGPGTMFLNGTNTYSGGTTISAGTVVVNNASNLGTGNLTIGEGTLEVATGFSTTRNIALTASSSSIAVDASQTYNSSGTISGIGSLNKEGDGTLTLSGATTYAGDTVIDGGTLTVVGANNRLASTSSIIVNTGGTLLLGGTDQISSTPPITLNGGAIAKGNFSEGAANAVGLGALTLSANSTIDFGTGTVGVLSFASFTPDSNTLTINNWTGVNGTVGTASTDRLIFDTDQAANLAFFSFTGYSSAIEFNLGGGFFEVVPVPEPSTWIAGGLASCVIGIQVVRRRRSRLAVGSFIGRKSFRVLAVSLTLLQTMARDEQAGTLTWTGGGTTNDTSDAGNWGGFTPAAGDLLHFAGSTRLTPNQVAAFSASSITFDSGADAFTLGGSTYTITTADGVTNNSTNTQTINNNVILGSSQTWAATNGNLFFGGNVNNGGFVLTIDGSATTTIDGVISGTGTFIKNGSGTVIFSGNQDDTYTGETFVNDGELGLAKGGKSALDAPVTIGDGIGAPNSAIARDLNTAGPELSNEPTITINSDGLLDLNDDSDTSGALIMTSGNVTTGTGTLILGGTASSVTTNAASASAVISGKLRLSTDGTFTVADGAAAQDLVVSAATSGLGDSLTKNGAGTMVLSGNNTYTGATIINAGTLIAGAPSGAALGSTSGITVNSSGTLLLGANDQIKNAAPLTLAGGTFDKGDFSEGNASTQGIGALTLTAAGSHIDFGTGVVGVLSFDSFAPGTFILTIDNWTGTANTVGTGSTDRLIFDVTQAANLNSFAFTGYEPGAVQFDLANGFFEVVPVVAVPEPSTWTGAGLAVVLLGFNLVWRRRVRDASTVAPILLLGVVPLFIGCSGRTTTSVTAKVLAVEETNPSTMLQVGQHFSAGEAFRLRSGQEVTIAFTPAVMAQLLDDASIVISKLRLGRDGNETGHDMMERDIEIRCLSGSIIASLPAEAVKTRFVLTTDSGSVSVEPGSLFYLIVSEHALQVTCPRGTLRFTATNSADVIIVPPGKWLVYEKGATTRSEPQAAFENARAQQDVTLALEAEATMQALLAAEQRAVPSWRHL